MAVSISTATDHDNAISEKGVHHEQPADTDWAAADVVEKGWPAADWGVWDVSSPYRFYPGNEDSGSTLNEVSGNNDMTAINGDPTPNQSGVLGRSAWAYDGNDYWGPQNEDDFATNTFSYAILVFAATGGLDSGRMAGGEWGDDKWFVGYNNTDDAWWFAWEQKGGTEFATRPATPTPTEGEWHLLGGSYDRPNGECRAYVDGSKVDTVTGVTDDLRSPLKNFFIGHDNNHNQWNGRIANWLVDFNAYSDTDHSELYDAIFGTSEIWYEHTDSGAKTSFDITTTTTIPANTSITVTIYEDVGNDDTGANSVTDPNGTTHNYENSDSVTLAGGVDETNTFSGFDGGGSTNAYITRVELSNDTADATNTTPQFNELSFDVTAAAVSGGVRSTDASGVIQTTSGVVQTT